LELAKRGGPAHHSILPLLEVAKILTSAREKVLCTTDHFGVNMAAFICNHTFMIHLKYSLRTRGEEEGGKRGFAFVCG
jgi:hypothetical protein